MAIRNRRSSRTNADVAYAACPICGFPRIRALLIARRRRGTRITGHDGLWRTITMSLGDNVLDDAMAAVLRTKTPAERLQIAFRLWAFARDTIQETLRRNHPDWTEDEITRQVAHRMSHGAVGFEPRVILTLDFSFPASDPATHTRLA